MDSNEKIVIYNKGYLLKSTENIILNLEAAEALALKSKQEQETLTLLLALWLGAGTNQLWQWAVIGTVKK